MKKFFTLAAAMLAAVGMASAQDACYIIGEVNGNSWACDNGVEMTKVSDGVFKATVDVDGYFGFAWQLCDEWDGENGINTHRLYPADGVQMVTLVDDKAVIELSTEKNGGDSWTLGAKATATFTVDYNEMTLTVEAGGVEVDENVYVVGDLSSWGFDPAYAMTKVSEGVYEIKGITVAGGFKIANSAWAPTNVGAPQMEDPENPGEWIAAAQPKLNEPFEAWNDGASKNMVINDDAETAFEVNIKLDTTGDAPIVTITSSDGVANVAADIDAPAVYYNLQGVRVNNPENGLFIVKKGANATKVLVK